MITRHSFASGATDAVVRHAAPHRRSSGFVSLAALVLLAFINHILIYHPFESSYAFDDHRSPALQDVETCSETAEDGDISLVNGQRGVSRPSLTLAGALSPVRLHQLLLIAADDHPPKA